MFKINKITDYAAIIMKFLVSCEGSVSASYIAEKVHISLPMVRKVLKKLHKAQLVQSIQGYQGGYAIAKDPRNITLAEIIKAIDGDLALANCLTSNNTCQQQLVCGISKHWLHLQQQIQHILEKTTLADWCEEPIIFP